MTGLSGPWTDQRVIDRYISHLQRPRGRIRIDVTLAQVKQRLDTPGRVLDVGAGGGEIALSLALVGHTVTAVEPSTVMVTELRKKLGLLSVAAAERVRIVQLDGEAAALELAPEQFDAVLCHGVLMYLDDPAPLLRALAGLCASDGFLSVLTKSDLALAMRPALQGRYADALSELGVVKSKGWLGVQTRGDSPERLRRLMSDLGFTQFDWFGIGIFSDHFDDTERLDDQLFGELVELERACSPRDPYRSMARLFHAIAARS